MGLDLDDYDFENPIGFDGENELYYFDDEYSNFGFFGRIGAGLKSFVKNPAKAMKDLVKDTSRNVKKVGKEIGKGLHKGFQLFNRFLNPLTIAGRTGALFVIARNYNRMADKLAPLFLADNDPLLKKYKPDAITKIRGKKGDIEQAWNNMGGAVKGLREAVLEGRGRKPSLFVKGKQVNFDGSISEFIYSYSFDGEDFNFYGNLDYNSYEGNNLDEEKYSNFIEPATATMIGAGMSLVTAIIGIIAKSGAPNQPYQEGTTESQVTGGETTLPTAPLDPNQPIVSPDGKAVIDATTGATYKSEELKTSPDGAKPETSLQTNPDGTPKTEEKFLGMPKKIGIGVTVGVGVLALTGIIIAVARKK